MNLLELLGVYVPARVLRAILAFVLGFSLMCMWLAAEDVYAGRWAVPW